MLPQLLDLAPIQGFRGRDFLALADYTSTEIRALLDLAIKLKRQQRAGESTPLLRGKTLGMIFEKNSTRTRVSFEVGIHQLGGTALFLSRNDLQLGRGETIADTARTLSRYVDALMIRTFAHQTVVELAAAATVPVINGLTDLEHPCQALADFQTILEQKGRLAGLKLAFVGDGNNVVHSLMLGAAKLGLHVAVATPEGYEPNPQVVALAKAAAAETGATVELCHDPAEAVAGADIVYTDVWTSMGCESEQEARQQAFASFQVNEALLRYAQPDFHFMHCLPAHRGEEVTAPVIDGAHSIVFEQAENRLHAQKALLVAIMRGE
jgi:ornithine carbamoyltransferase